jgi:hypothetical protein
MATRKKAEKEARIETKAHPIKSTYEVGKTILDDSEQRVIAREERQVVVSITTTPEGGVFHRGARIA